MPSSARLTSLSLCGLQSLAQVVAALPEPGRASLVHWILKYSRNQRVAYRMFALELIHSLILILATLDGPAAVMAGGLSASQDMEEGDLGGPAPALGTNVMTASEQAVELAHLILARVSDKAATVRARALTLVGDLAEAVAAGGRLAEIVVRSLQPTAQDIAAAVRDAIDAPASPGTTSGRVSLVHTLVRRARDEKSGVRKAALQTLEAILRLPGVPVTQTVLEVRESSGACRSCVIV